MGYLGGVEVFRLVLLRLYLAGGFVLALGVVAIL